MTSVPAQRRGSVCVLEGAVMRKRVAQRYYEEVLTARRLNVLDALLAPGFIGHDPVGATIDRADYIFGVHMVLIGFGRLDVRIEDQVAERDRVTTRWSATGTHTGLFAGIPGTGRQVYMSGIDIHRVDGEQFVELWEQIELANLLAQIL